jgi:hypothetical protein
MNEQTASSRLRAKLELVHPVMQQHAELIWSSPQLPELYPVYLRAMHTIVRSAVPLMEAALDRAGQLAETDEVAAGLARYLARHVDEERGHDQWLLEDLAVTGADPQEPLLRIPSPRVAALVGAQYYWLRHHHPIALIGHIAAIEGYPPPIGFAARLRRLTGYPKAAFRAIAVHERLDLRHRSELWDAIDGLPLRREHETMIGVSALHTIQSAVEVLAEVYASIPAPVSRPTTPRLKVGASGAE